MSAKWIFILLGVGFLSVQAFRFQKRGLTIDSLKKSLSQTNAELTDTRTQLDAERRSSRKFEHQVGDLTKENGDQRAQILAGERDAARTDERIEQGKRKVNDLANQLQAKQLDVAYYKGLADNNLPSTVESDSAKRNVVKLSGYVQVYKDSTRALKVENGQQREKIGQLERDKSQLQGEISDLEQELNNKNQAVANAIDAVPQGFANIGYGRRIRKVTGAIRAGKVR